MKESGERGQSLVELALVLPILLLITLGVVDLTRVFGDWVALNNGVREGALWASEPPNYSDSTNVRNVVLQEGPLDSSRLTFNSLTCSPSPCAPTSDSVTVSASYQVQLIFPFLTDLLGNSVTMTVVTTAPIIEHSGATGP
jgi:Flp pilus assembly protein TadG